MTSPQKPPERRTGDERPPRRPRNLFTLMLILAVAALLILLYSNPGDQHRITWKAFMDDVRAGKVKSIVITQGEVAEVEG
jgi:hypothetical protein